MNLGENIYKLRTGKNMSQGDLADALEVSRQSVSKWENNSSVPDLDKLIKMSAFFGVSLDALAGASVQDSPRPTPVTPAQVFPEPQRTSGTVPGMILLLSALIICLIISQGIGLLAGFHYTLPLTVCGILCLCLKRRRGLWCCWTLLFFVSTYLFCTLGIGTEWFWHHFLKAITSCTGWVEVLISLAVNATTIALSIWTIRSYMNAAIRMALRGKVKLALGWGLSIIPGMLANIFQSLWAFSLSWQSQHQFLFMFGFHALNWVHLTARMIMLVLTIGCLHKAKNSQ